MISGRRGHVRVQHNYQGIILAEFVAAELLIAMTPIATKKNQGKTGFASPYVARDMTKLMATALAFFLLALLPVFGPGPGRFGAWFGGLVLISVGLNEGANIAKTLDIFGGGQQQPAAAQTLPAVTGTSPQPGIVVQ